MKPLKGEWAIKETDWLGYWHVPQSLEALEKGDQCHTTYGLSSQHHGTVHVHWLHGFDMWPSCAHILKPLTYLYGLIKKAPIIWIDEMQKAFNKMH